MQVILSAGELGGETVEWATDTDGQPAPKAVFTDNEGRQRRYVFAAWTTPPQGAWAGIYLGGRWEKRRGAE